jgi:hypothetical protein
MTNNVTYTIALTPENAEKIDAVNRILLGESYTAKAPAKTTPAKEPAKQEAPAKTETTTESSGLTLDQIKRAAKKAKSAHGEDFANSVLDEFGVKEASSLGRRMSSIDEGDYDAIAEKWAAGPQVTEQASDEPEDDLDDGFDDDDGLGDDESEVTADAVKTALKAYAKEVGRDEAKEIMQKHGAAALSKVDDCTPAQLKAMFAELV